ncbi:1-ACYL-SN-GLYCEROL-3-PHOSPHATE ACYLTRANSFERASE ALPHA [Salix koriyanagi]|uniref:1-ACYL-SN-GLYCEROL-3-PHOSPHATE ACYLTRANSFERASE ALPHA n=1 Tax=Salix koriyanagi TaxID=2511006 RepID=A0A9Q0ZAW5_9ROSI|nr:1-ACYL-SN-GLYCEROL-3-PHOSPHATE ACYLTRANSFERASE ALPHA [Salix koriyanagi]
MFAEEEDQRKMVVFNSRIKFDHPYYDDVDEYYLGLSNETEYEKEASNPREKEFGDSFKLLTIAERHQFLKTQTSRVFVPKKRRGSGGPGFTSMIKTQCTDQKAKSTTGSIDESGSPLGAILVPEKRRASRHKFVRKNNHCIMMSTDQEDVLTAKMKSKQEKQTAGRKRVLKSQRVVSTRECQMWILGNPIRIQGSEFSSERAIYICNHASPIDIFLMMWLTPTGTVGIAKKEGFVHLALQTRLPIVPMIFAGTHRAWRKGGLHVRPAPITVRYLRPIKTDDWTDDKVNDCVRLLHDMYVENLPEAQMPLHYR